MMMRWRPLAICSMRALPRTLMRPRPVVYASLMPSRPKICAPVGKSGPLMMRISSSVVASGLSISLMRPSTTSVKLWGGMLVAIPTAMPAAPFTSKFGMRAGKTTGCCSDSSKLGMKSTVSLSMSRSISIAMADRRASVYRIAAGRVSVHAAEIAVPVHQRITKRKVLRHPHHGVVNGRVAVRMVFTHDVADDTGRLAVGPIRTHAQLAHAVQNAPLHRLESVAHVGQRPVDDDAHRVVDVGTPHLVGDPDGHDATFGKLNGHSCVPSHVEILYFLGVGLDELPSRLHFFTH